MAYLLAFIGILNFLLGYYVYRNNPRKRVNKIFFFLALTVCIWVLVNVPVFTPWKGDYPWIYLTYAMGALIPPMMLYWLLVYLGVKVQKLFLLLYFGLYIALFIVCLIPGLLIERATEGGSTLFALNITPTSFFLPYSLLMTVGLLFPIVFLLFYSWRKPGIEKVRSMYILMGMGFPVIISAVTAFILPLFGIVDIINIDVFTSFIFVGLITYAITRYRLLDTRVLLQRGLVYLLTLLVVLGIYSYLIVVLYGRLEHYWQENQRLSIFLLVLFVALGYPLVKQITERLIRLVFRDKQELDLAVKELREKLYQAGNVGSLTNTVEQMLSRYYEADPVRVFMLNKADGRLVDSAGKGMDVESSIITYLQAENAVLITEEIPHLLEDAREQAKQRVLVYAEREMKKLAASLAAPVVVDGEVLALIIIGTRKGGGAYTVQDVEYIDTVRSQVGMAFASALLYQDAMKRITAI